MWELGEKCEPKDLVCLKINRKLHLSVVPSLCYHWFPQIANVELFFACLLFKLFHPSVNSSIGWVSGWNFSRSIPFTIILLLTLLALHFNKYPALGNVYILFLGAVLADLFWALPSYWKAVWQAAEDCVFMTSCPWSPLIFSLVATIRVHDILFFHVCGKDLWNRWHLSGTGRCLALSGCSVQGALRSWGILSTITWAFLRRGLKKKPRRGYCGLITSHAFIRGLYGKSIDAGVLLFCECMCMQTCSVTQGLHGAAAGVGLYVLFGLWLCQSYSLWAT